MNDKGSVVFKHSAEDFIVEEVWDKEICKISQNTEIFSNSKVDFGRFDVNDRRDFIFCEMEKIDIDHFSAMEILTKAINAKMHEIGYGGTKDKIAWSCQRISIFNPKMDLIKNFHNPNIILKNFRWGKHKIKTGDLSGNRFRVVLRDADKDAIKILSKLRNSEFIPNYFGEQRFGSLRNDNVKIGKLILKKKFKEAVFAFLIGFGENESDEVKDAKKKLKENKNIAEARNYFPEKLRTEKRILDYLSSNKDDWIGALRMIGEKTLLIMCQSVQSKIFNEILERVTAEGINAKSLNLIGYNSEISDGRVGKIEWETLELHDMRFEDFKIVEFPELSLKASKRRAFFKIQDLEVFTEDDELFIPSKKIILSFKLDSGVYATTLLEQFFELR
ncbi:TPA: tRNA pseudouridine(13) synthase TruD [Candidatus Woesearchaeota archaeon]|nr:tRNA pseudouridine(13) synthase TruD [Candidatus Woesearchaeota archaeon]